MFFFFFFLILRLFSIFRQSPICAVVVMQVLDLFCSNLPPSCFWSPSWKLGTMGNPGVVGLPNSQENFDDSSRWSQKDPEEHLKNHKPQWPPLTSTLFMYIGSIMLPQYCSNVCKALQMKEEATLMLELKNRSWSKITSRFLTEKLETLWLPRLLVNFSVDWKIENRNIWKVCPPLHLD